MCPATLLGISLVSLKWWADPTPTGKPMDFEYIAACVI